MAYFNKTSCCLWTIPELPATEIPVSVLLPGSPTTDVQLLAHFVKHAIRRSVPEQMSGQKWNNDKGPFQGKPPAHFSGKKVKSHGLVTYRRQKPKVIHSIIHRNVDCESAWINLL